MQDFRDEPRQIPIQGVKASIMIISVIIFPIALILALVHQSQRHANFRTEFLIAFILGLFAVIIISLGEPICVLIMILGLYAILRYSTYIRSLN